MRVRHSTSEQRERQPSCRPKAPVRPLLLFLTLFLCSRLFVCAEEECNIGDVVEIRVCRPMSKRKRFTLHRILKPKLPIEEGARRFEAHQPEWKKSPEQIAYEQQEAGNAAPVAAAASS